MRLTGGHQILVELLERCPREVGVRFALDCAARVVCLTTSEPEAAAVAGRVLELGELWLADQDAGYEVECGEVADQLASMIGRWVDNPQSNYNTPAYFALEACVWAGRCTELEMFWVCAEIAANRSVIASGVQAPGDGQEANQAEMDWQTERLCDLAWPDLDGLVRELAMTVVSDTDCSTVEAETVAVLLGMGSAC